jgi:hypothetical protein
VPGVAAGPGDDTRLAAMRLRLLVPAILVVAGAVAVSLVLSTGSKTTRSSPARVQLLPQGFVGAMADGPLLGPGVDLGGQLDSMVASGVESVRVTVNWAADQPYPTEAQVPSSRRSQFQDVAGVPTRFADLDRLVAAAAPRGLSVLPVVEYTPGWDLIPPGSTASPPRSPAPYAAFLAALARRYGPRGSFWAAHPGLPVAPIRMWQIWNEPDFASYWSVQPFAPSYVRLLAASRAALRTVDPQARVVLGGLPDFSWRYLAQIYAVPGAAGTFDLVAIHPYTAQPQGVLVILSRVRAVMSHSGDTGKPILITELSWPSSAGKAPQQFGIGTTEALQAQRLNRVMPLLAANRTRLGLAGFYWYTWMGNESPGSLPYAFDYAGLLRYAGGRITPKPALAVFRRQALAIEGCRRKGAVAGSCL